MPSRYEMFDRAMHVISANPAAYRWRYISSRSPNGVIGDASTASPEKGEKLLAAVAQSFAAALLVKEFFAQEIKDGRLVQPFDIEVDTDAAYWLAFPEARRNVPKIKTFRDWILAEIGRPAA